MLSTGRQERIVAARWEPEGCAESNLSEPSRPKERTASTTAARLSRRRHQRAQLGQSSGVVVDRGPLIVAVSGHCDVGEGVERDLADDAFVRAARLDRWQGRFRHSRTRSRGCRQEWIRMGQGERRRLPIGQQPGPHSAAGRSHPRFQRYAYSSLSTIKKAKAAHRAGSRLRLEGLSPSPHGGVADLSRDPYRRHTLGRRSRRVE